MSVQRIGVDAQLDAQVDDRASGNMQTAPIAPVMVLRFRKRPGSRPSIVEGNGTV